MKIAVIFGTVITLLLLPIGALLGCQQQPQPVQTPSPTPSTVLKVKTMILLNSGFDIHIMNADDSDPYWSRDGSLIAFTSNRDRKEEVYVMYANGSDQHPVIEKYMPIPTPMPPPPPAPIFPIISTIIFCILAWMFWLLLGKTTFGISRAAVLATAIPQAVLAIAIYTIGLLLQPLSRMEIAIAQ